MANMMDLKQKRWYVIQFCSFPLPLFLLLLPLGFPLCKAIRGFLTYTAIVFAMVLVPSRCLCVERSSRLSSFPIVSIVRGSKGL
jgi:hypothetical protein